AVAWRFELGFTPRFQGVVDHHLQHPVTQRRDAMRNLHLYSRNLREASRSATRFILWMAAPWRSATCGRWVISSSSWWTTPMGACSPCQPGPLSSRLADQRPGSEEADHSCT